MILVLKRRMNHRRAIERMDTGPLVVIYSASGLWPMVGSVSAGLEKVSPSH